MLVQAKQLSSIKLLQKRLETGLTKIKLNLLRPPEGIGDIKSKKLVINQNSDTYMQEFHQENKNKTYKDKSSTLEKNILVMKLSKTLDLDLTSKDKVSEEYWNNYSKEISKKLSYHHQIDLADLEQENSLSGSLNNSEGPLRYLKTNCMKILTKSYQKTYWKLLQSSRRDITGEENIKQITRKIRIYPNKEQKILFDKCFGAHRYFYNQALAQFLENNKIENLKDRSYANTFISLRNKVIINDSDLREEDNNLWMKDVPYDTRQNAVNVLVSAIKAAKSNKKNGNIDKFQMRFRSKKICDDVFYVNKKTLINGHIFKRRLGKNAKLIAKKDKDLIKSSIGDFPIVKEKDGRYYACICIKPLDKKSKPKKNICALDPGVRTFQTMYSEKSIGEFGFDTSKKLYPLYHRENKLKSILATKKLSSRKKYKLKKRCALLRTKIKHIVQDLHWKTADYLTKHYQVILLPVFNSKQMANKKKRKISKTTTRLLLGLQHYSFQQKLLYKAKQRGRNVILCKEHYTTKCCGSCGELNHTIGGSKVFKCKKCNLCMDRDIHAARNILIRALTHSVSELSDAI